MTLPSYDHWLWWIPAFFIGSCIGSFLNVVIYRVPRDLSVNEPKRSFCPHCRKPIPMRRNIPLLSWLWLRGKCADCGQGIPFRYFAVELLTGVAFLAVWMVFPPLVVIPLWILVALLIAITFIDAEHFIIPLPMTWAGSVVGLAACALWPRLPALPAGGEGDWWSGVSQGIFGWVVAFAGLWVVMRLGKMAFGRRALKFAKPAAWKIKDAEGDDQPMLFIIDGEETAWHDIFYRKTDRMVVEAERIRVDGKPAGKGTLVIRAEHIELPDGTIRALADVEAVDGTATSVVIPREAMGAGDLHLLAMIGAFIGWAGVLFSLFASSILALIAALVARIGFGREIPYGPYLAMGAVVWLFGGWRLWEWYMNFVSLAGGR